MRKKRREKETHKYFSAIDSVDGAHYVIERVDGKDLPSPRGKKTNLTHMETWEPDRPSPDSARWIDCIAFYEAFGVDDPPFEYEELIPVLQEAAKKRDIIYIQYILRCSLKKWMNIVVILQETTLPAVPAALCCYLLMR